MAMPVNSTHPDYDQLLPAWLRVGMKMALSDVFAELKQEARCR
jgi:hypothetical protein